MFGSVPAVLLYVSATQINFAVRLIGYPQVSAELQVTVNDLNAQPRVIPLESGSSHLFINGSETYLDTLSNPNGYSLQNALPEFSAAGGWIVTGVTQTSPFILQVDLQAPSVFCGLGAPACSVNLPLISGGTAIGPLPGEYLYISQ